MTSRDAVILTFCIPSPFSIRSAPSVVLLGQVPFMGLCKQSTLLLAFVCFSHIAGTITYHLDGKNLVFNN